MGGYKKTQFKNVEKKSIKMTVCALEYISYININPKN
jgi:hypothetical protein